MCQRPKRDETDHKHLDWMLSRDRGDRGGSVGLLYDLRWKVVIR